MSRAFATTRWTLVLAAGRAGEAQRRAEEVLKLDPYHVDALIMRGSALAKQNRFDDAIAVVDSAVELDHGASARMALGDVKLMAGDEDGARTAYQSAVTGPKA